MREFVGPLCIDRYSSLFTVYHRATERSRKSGNTRIIKEILLFIYVNIVFLNFFDLISTLFIFLVTGRHLLDASPGNVRAGRDGEDHPAELISSQLKSAGSFIVTFQIFTVLLSETAAS